MRLTLLASLPFGSVNYMAFLEGSRKSVHQLHDSLDFLSPEDYDDIRSSMLSSSLLVSLSPSSLLLS